MTRTHSTTNAVIDAVSGSVWCEDFTAKATVAAGDAFAARAARFIDVAHSRVFVSVKLFTEWLFEVGATVDKCWILGETLIDAERAA